MWRGSTLNFSKQQLFYPCLSEFNRQLRDGLFTEEHVQLPQVKFNSLDLPDGDKEVEQWFWGYVLEKEGHKYLFSGQDNSGKEIKIRDTLPFKIKGQTSRVAHGGKVYYQIQQFQKFKFSSRQTMSFRKLVDTLTTLEHTNHDHYLLNWFNGLTSLFTRYYVRTSTPAGFGKDSTVDILANLVGKCATIESPTIAKLEDRVSLLKWLLVNEVNDIPKASWQIIQQFLLTCGAFKPTVTKHSRAYKNVGEEIDLSENSIGLAYNDIDHYSDSKAYFDNVTMDAVKDRFVPFRLYGKMVEDFNKVDMRTLKPFVQSHFDDYLELIHNLMYYSEHINEATHSYCRKGLKMNVGRQETNLNRLLGTVDAYCNDQAEFNRWLVIIQQSMLDYAAMTIYPNVLPNLYKKFEIAKDVYETFRKIDDCYNWLVAQPRVNKDLISYVEKIRCTETFIRKNSLIESYNKETIKGSYEDKGFWEK